MRKAIIKYGELTTGILKERDQGDYILRTIHKILSHVPCLFKRNRL